MAINPQEWLSDFNSASQAKNRDALHALRKAVYQDTVKTVMADYADDAQFIAATKFYVSEIPPISAPKYECTEIDVWESDTLVAAKRMLDEGLNPAVLNLASRRNPGGGVRNGAGAQEENLFRRSNLFRSMCQFTTYAHWYGLKRSVYQYPMDRNWGGVYSPGATIIKGPEYEGYPMLVEPYKVDVVSVAAINVSRENKSGEPLNDAQITGTRNKMRTIFRIALENGNDSLLLGAFGCGAFKNPPAQIARLFHETLEDAEFKNAFKKVVFAIIENHNSYGKHNPEGNIAPFRKEFNLL